MAANEISSGARKTQEAVLCFDCCGVIERGETCDFYTAERNGGVFTIYRHFDCREAAERYRHGEPWSKYVDGCPPLVDDIMASNHPEQALTTLRGSFPGVTARLEARMHALQSAWTPGRVMRAVSSRVQRAFRRARRAIGK